jgi:hypothetical protein
MTQGDPRSYVSRRIWLFDNQIVTSPQLDATGAHRLRAILLGNFWSDGYDGNKVAAEAASVLKTSKEKAQKCGLPLQAWIIWNNVRSARETGKHASYHLSDAEVKALKSGQVLTFRDKLGEFKASLAPPKP